MTLKTTIFLVVFYLFTSTTVKGALLTLGCDPLNATCPPFATCVPACHTNSIDHICRCDEKNFFFKDLQTIDFQCYTMVRIGATCNSTHRCPGLEAECANGKCICRPPYSPTDNMMRCKPQPFFKPQPVEFAVLGEFCNEDIPLPQLVPHGYRIHCINPEEMECVSGSCRCRLGLRPASISEMVRNINSGFYCRPENLQLLRSDHFRYN